VGARLKLFIHHVLLKQLFASDNINLLNAVFAGSHPLVFVGVLGDANVEFRAVAADSDSTT